MGTDRLLRAFSIGAHLPIVEDPWQPLTGRDRDGREIEVLCRQIEGRLYFHPDRLAWLRGELDWRDRGKAAALDRWADDGGRA